MAWTDAKGDDRCKADITLKDGSKAQCGKKANRGKYCHLHAHPKSTPTKDTP